MLVGRTILVSSVVLLMFSISQELRAQKEVTEEEIAEGQVSKKVAEYFEPMRSGDYGKFGKITIPKWSCDDIPSLLVKAKSSEPLAAFPSNPLSSMMQRECTEGVLAMWLIEGIRSQTDFPSLNPFLHKSDDPDITPEALQAEALKAYQAWWEKVREDPEELMSSIDPFEGTRLHWY